MFRANAFFMHIMLLAPPPHCIHRSPGLTVAVVGERERRRKRKSSKLEANLFSGENAKRHLLILGSFFLIMNSQQRNNCSLREWKAELENIWMFNFCWILYPSLSPRWVTRSPSPASVFFAYIHPTSNSTHHVKRIKYLFMQKLCCFVCIILSKTLLVSHQPFIWLCVDISAFWNAQILPHF